MKKPKMYVIYTQEGETFNLHNDNTFNCQILDFMQADSAEEAAKLYLEQQARYAEQGGFESVYDYKGFESACACRDNDTFSFSFPK